MHGLRNALPLGLLILLNGCSPRMTLIDMRAMSVWKTTDTATSCVIEKPSVDNTYHESILEFPLVSSELRREIFYSYGKNLPFFGFPGRITVDLHHDPCQHSPDLHRLSIRLFETRDDHQRDRKEMTSVLHDSLLLVFDTSLVHDNRLANARTNLNILQVGQEDLRSWGLRLDTLYRQSEVWELDGKSRFLWIQENAWLPGQRRTLVMQSTTVWGNVYPTYITIVDTFTVDVAAKRLYPGFQP